MKKISMFFFAAILSTSLMAQSNKEDIDILQSVMGKEKKAMVSDFLQLPAGPQADAFWKIYDEYETKRKELGRRRIALLEKYANSYGNMDDAQMDGLVKEMQTLGLDTDKLIYTYYGKMKKPVGIKASAQFYQLETYFLSVVRATILENIPFIGELDGK